jgi:hypothetical protein
MAEEKDAFYVVKKGNVVGIYKSFADIQPLLSSSVCIHLFPTLLCSSFMQSFFVFELFLHLGMYAL